MSARPALSAWVAVVGLLFALSMFCRAATPTSQERLSRTNLLAYHNRAGEVKIVRSRSDWQKRRAEIIAGMEQVMGPMPSNARRCPLTVQTTDEADCGLYVRKTLTYESEPNSRVPALLLVPKTALESKEKFPAVLVLHPTDAQYGHRVIAEELRPAYRAYGRDLVERDYVVLAPAYPHLANYAPDLRALGYQSGTMKAIWDNRRALDLLDSLPYVRKGKYAAVGHSLGGHNAIYTAVFDPRIKAVVSSCGFDSYLDYMDGKIDGWTSERYMPKLLEYKGRLQDIPFDFHELLGALAPRPVFVNAPLGDTNFKWRSVDEVVAAASQVYAVYGARENLQVRHPDCGHDFPPQLREEAYRFLDRVLK